MKIEVTGTNVELPRGLNRDITERAERAFERFATDLRRVEVVINDENGPRGGADTRCRVTVFGDGGDPVVVTGRGENAGQAAMTTLRRAQRAVAERTNRKADHRVRV